MQVTIYFIEKKKKMKNLINICTTIVMLLWWFAGLTLTKGFLSTAIGICMPLWPMYLVVEKYLMSWLNSIIL